MSADAALRVLLVDDHELFRSGLRALLEEDGLLLADAPSGEAALVMLPSFRPDVIVMDLNMPGMSGIEVTRKLVERTPASQVLVVSVSAQEADVTDAILARASGYVLKESPVEEVVAGIQAAAGGQSLISPRIATMLLQRIRDAAGAVDVNLAPANLSARELEVLRLLAEGYSNPAIAEALFIGTRTAQTHVQNILTKLGVNSRAEAVRCAVAQDLL